MPRDIDLAFVDAPVVTASAARHLDLAKYEVRRVGGDVFEADDGNGAYGTHEVLARGPR